ncbi:MAG: adenosylcobinamide amidohydrolase, partial [Deltaproteobacteria bacterium]|nr:adenosylcobinamide amidohydrolase [Deltaproteobacteria bacterium]
MKPRPLAVFFVLFVSSLASVALAGPMTPDPELGEILAIKIAKIPPEKLKTVVFVERRGQELAVAGQGSVLTAIVQKAGGLSPPDLGPGESTALTLALWKKLKPQAVAIRAKDQAELTALFKGGPWKSALAVKNKEIYPFPDGLVDQAANYQDYFAAWLAGTLYPAEFAKIENLARPQGPISSKPIKLKIPYVAEAAVVDSRILDFVHRTLVIRFKRPLAVLSTNDGALGGVLAVGNSYSPAPTWPIHHLAGYDGSMEQVYKALGLSKGQASIMGTGADLNNLVVATKTHKDLTVTALVTAGIEGNALRAGSDEGAWVEPGTINVIVLSNRGLTPGAMANAVIFVTEAKTA